MLGPVNSAEILAFWFGDLDADGFANSTHRQRWFAGGNAFDDEIAHRFGDLIDACVAATRLEIAGPKDRLAHILVLDQFTRNTRRNSAEAFAGDALALELATHGVEQGDDLTLAWDERAFFYLPFEHSESRLHQHTAVGLFHHLHASAPKHRRDITGNTLRYAERHRSAIERFGRFPHRNALLSRDSTPAEAAYLADGGGFG